MIRDERLDLEAKIELAHDGPQLLRGLARQRTDARHVEGVFRLAEVGITVFDAEGDVAQEADFAAAAQNVARRGLLVGENERAREGADAEACSGRAAHLRLVAAQREAGEGIDEEAVLEEAHAAAAADHSHQVGLAVPAEEVPVGLGTRDVAEGHVGHDAEDDGAPDLMVIADLQAAEAAFPAQARGRGIVRIADADGIASVTANVEARLFEGFGLRRSGEAEGEEGQSPPQDLSQSHCRTPIRKSGQRRSGWNVPEWHAPIPNIINHKKNLLSIVLA